ncbi:MAG: GTP-binding protein, partial [Antricoccus sp.]
NKLAREERSVVDSVAGTTVDPVDSVVMVGGEPWRFVDTAGLRRRVKDAQGAEFYASLRTASAIDSAEIGVVLIDASEPISEQDQRVISQVIESGRALVLAMNKWDLMSEDRRYYLDREIDRELVRIPWAQRINISAKTGRAVEKLAPAMKTALASWDTRVPTAKLNAWLSEVASAHPHPVRSGKQPRILFATQASSRPPRFIIFTTGFIDPPYLRFLERRMREDFGFIGSPIRISVRERKRR